MLAKPVNKNKMYGQLNIIKEVDAIIRPNNRKRRRVLCKCSCGNKTTINLDALVGNRNTTCGKCALIKPFDVSELCNKFKIGYNTVNNRLHMGWSVEKAIQIKEVI
jgi:hypothetical protein